MRQSNWGLEASTKELIILIVRIKNKNHKHSAFAGTVGSMTATGVFDQITSSAHVFAVPTPARLAPATLFLFPVALTPFTVAAVELVFVALEEV